MMGGGYNRPSFPAAEKGALCGQLFSGGSLIEIITFAALDYGFSPVYAGIDVAVIFLLAAFVFYADHYSYYNDLDHTMKNIPEGKAWDLNDSNIPFFLWSGSCMDLDVENLYEGYTYENTEEHAAERSVYEGEYYYAIRHRADEPIGGTAVTKSCNSFDVLPTVFDLLGYEYRQGLYHGISVFKEETSVFVSRETGAAFTDNYYYDGSDLYLRAETAGGETASADGQIVFSGNTVRVQKSGGFVTYDASALKSFFYVQSFGDYIVLNTAAGSAYFSDAASDFLRKVVAYYAKQEIIEDMYQYDLFSYVSIDLCVRKV